MAAATTNPVARYWALREQADYLRSPDRNGGPSRHEAEEAADALDREANDLSESLFYQTTQDNACRS